MLQSRNPLSLVLARRQPAAPPRQPLRPDAGPAGNLLLRPSTSFGLMLARSRPTAPPCLVLALQAIP